MPLASVLHLSRRLADWRAARPATYPAAASAAAAAVAVPTGRSIAVARSTHVSAVVAGSAALLALPLSVLAAPAPAALPQPQLLLVDPGLPAAQVEARKRAALNFYAFWQSGAAQYLDAAIAPNFTDGTLPPGRSQGPQGPLEASRIFHAAVPDLRCEIRQLIVSGDRVVAHLRFSGHFTGTFSGRQGHGENVDFIATDILRIPENRITDNWHLEDNLTLLQQLGVLTPPQEK